MQVRRAYRSALSRSHPDKGGDTEAFALLQAAYEVLSDTHKVCNMDLLAAATISTLLGHDISMCKLQPSDLF